MGRTPRRIRAVLTLRTGDKLEAVAFRRDNRDGLTMYEVALPDGSPFVFPALMGADLWLEMIPARSSVVFRAVRS